MTAIYDLRILDRSGTLLHQLSASAPTSDITKTGYLDLAYRNNVNSYGTAAFILPYSHLAIPDITERCQIEIWRNDPDNGVGWMRDWEGIFLDEKRWYDKSTNRHLFKAYCYGSAFQMLEDRYVMWKSGVINRSAFTGVAAETIMKTLMQYNCTSSANVSNGREVDGTIAGLSIQADGGGGNVVDCSCAWKRLLDVLQSVASTGGGDFDLIKTGAAAWEFRWYAGQRGTDRRATVIFSDTLGNMTDQIYLKTRSGKKTSLVVGGQGLEDNRMIGSKTGNGYSATDNFEKFFSSTSQASTVAGLQDVADQQLYAARDIESLSFSILPTPGTVYNRDYFLGDLVTGLYQGVSSTLKITGIGVSIESTGRSVVTPELTYVG
jgi:hypothetical protein